MAEQKQTRRGAVAREVQNGNLFSCCPSAKTVSLLDEAASAGGPHTPLARSGAGIRTSWLLDVVGNLSPPPVQHESTGALQSGPRARIFRDSRRTTFRWGKHAFFFNISIYLSVFVFALWLVLCGHARLGALVSICGRDGLGCET